MKSATFQREKLYRIVSIVGDKQVKKNCYTNDHCLRCGNLFQNFRGISKENSELNDSSSKAFITKEAG